VIAVLDALVGILSIPQVAAEVGVAEQGVEDRALVVRDGGHAVKVRSRGAPQAHLVLAAKGRLRPGKAGSR